MSPEEELFALSVDYALAADRRDAAAYCAVFAPDGVLRLCDPHDPTTVTSARQGHDALAEVPALLGRYERTFHLLGQARYRVEGERASGEVYCVANHLLLEGEHASNRVMYIRYDDRYSSAGGRWRITERTLRVDWTETRPSDHPARR